MVGAPNGVFLVLLGFARAGFEVLWYRAYWRTFARDVDPPALSVTSTWSFQHVSGRNETILQSAAWRRLLI